MRLKLLSEINILVVEDDDMARAALKLGLKSYCNAYFEASNGYDAIDIFKQNRVDIILTDIHMPGLNGLEMIEEIKKIKPQQSFIVITSYDTDQNFFRSVKEGAMQFIRKPLVIEDVQNALLLAVAKKDEKVFKLSPNIKVNLSNETIFDGEKQIFLTNIENKILWLFCYNINMVVTYDMIEEYVYDNLDVKKGSIHTAVLRLKKHLDGINIENISAKGYILRKFSEN
ncbi:response regulator transcription factor [Campylobacter fetus]|uniref:response regulator transcription factor n=1 Tax=Campylobacter fetus TaxID=196 RepID=UPI00073A7EA6|nr:response regulator transcription factor [Campylobacter fetus]ALV64425.1 two-component system response regulator [Campylobacter fetus subsp. testudinum Sp3]